jgi:hypothetical protein
VALDARGEAIEARSRGGTGEDHQGEAPRQGNFGHFLNFRGFSGNPRFGARIDHKTRADSYRLDHPRLAGNVVRVTHFIGIVTCSRAPGEAASDHCQRLFSFECCGIRSGQLEI